MLDDHGHRSILAVGIVELSFLPRLESGTPTLCSSIRTTIELLLWCFGFIQICLRDLYLLVV